MPRAPHPPPDHQARQRVDTSAEWDRAYAELWRRSARDSTSCGEPAQPNRLPLIAAIIAVLFGAMALVGLRDKIVRLAPATAALYSALGLKANPIGLELRGVSSKLVADGARKVLTVEGEIVNIRREANRVPPVALSVRGADGQPRYDWTAQAPKTRLEAGETMAFRARLASPPSDGAEVVVRFAGLDEARR